MYLKIYWKLGGSTLFPLSFWSVSEIEASVPAADVKKSVLLGSDLGLATATST
jgi:hypothetical protein|tara:strand:+ start:211 stop:369 length:159 start_codon:yes stop_codon:yes gene_type:complete